MAVWQLCNVMNWRRLIRRLIQSPCRRPRAARVVRPTRAARAAFVLNPKTAPYYDFYMRGAKSAAPSLGIEPVLTPIDNDAADIERAISTFAQSTPKGGLVIPGDSTSNAYRDLIVSLAARHRLPAVYTNEFFVTTGGLMSYGVDWLNEFGQAAFYVDRILRGAQPRELPVQAATKFITALNVKTAKARVAARSP